MITLDVPHVFRVFGGPRGLLRVLDRHLPRHGNSYAKVQMWKQRSRISAKWVGPIIYCIDREGYSFTEFLFDDDELGAPQGASGENKACAS